MTRADWKKIANHAQVYRTRTKVVSSKPIFNAGTERFMRDWRSGIVTIAVRDQRMREHDPILGVVSLKLSDILQTSSQVTRWYPLDGGIGFGRIRISLLFRSVETRLPPQQLGWDVGTFEFTSENILALGYLTTSKLKMRTGGSVAKLSRAECKKTDEGDGILWSVSRKGGKRQLRLPVRYRYRSPIIFEFHSANKRRADAYAVVHLHDLIDNTDEPINIPIWKTNLPVRLTQNYITQDNFKSIPDIQIEEVGRLQFRGRFKAGTDEDHAHFVSDNDSRETQETWEVCRAEGIRSRIVTSELSPATKQLHEQSLTKGRDVISEADEGEKEKWFSKDGTDWSGAFGQNPSQYAAQNELRNNSHAHTASGDMTHSHQRSTSGDTYLTYATYSDSEESDLGLRDATNSRSNDASGAGAAEDDEISSPGRTGSSQSSNPIKQYQAYKENSKALHREQRGLMQWKPMRNLQFAKDEAKFAMRKVRNKGTLTGRKPDVETET